MAKIITLADQTDAALPKGKSEEYVANFAKAANAQRIAEILARYASPGLVEAMLRIVIQRFKPEQRLTIVNESGLWF